MPKARQTATRALKISEPTPDQRELERRELREYLGWARRVIDGAGWNSHCYARRCRRHGCEMRCEARWRLGLRRLLGELASAQRQENSIDAATRDGPDAPARRALLADARRRGFLPLPTSPRGEADAAGE